MPSLAFLRLGHPKPSSGWPPSPHRCGEVGASPVRLLGQAPRASRRTPARRPQSRQQLEERESGNTPALCRGPAVARVFGFLPNRETTVTLKADPSTLIYQRAVLAVKKAGGGTGGSGRLRAAPTRLLKKAVPGPFQPVAPEGAPSAPGRASCQHGVSPCRSWPRLCSRR